MTDEFDFSAFDEFFPGSRHKRFDEAEEAVEEAGWADNPKVFAVNGVEQEFFTLGALAEALRRQPGTMRKWETQGWLPPAQYREPGGRRARLYTKPQIQGLVRIARACGLMNPEQKTNVKDTVFPEQAHELFRRLREERDHD